MLVIRIIWIFKKRGSVDGSIVTVVYVVWLRGKLCKLNNVLEMCRGIVSRLGITFVLGGKNKIFSIFFFKL